MPFDPRLLPILTATSDLPAVPPERLQAHWLRQRFAHPPIWQPETQIEAALPGSHGTLIPAAVLIPLVLHENAMTVLLTERAADLPDHAGQISFPGGRVEANDGSPQHTALRETAEEIGLHGQQIEVLGTLPDYRTGTGYSVTPVVGLVTPPLNLQLDHAEVAAAFEVPLHFLTDPQFHQQREIDFPPLGRRVFHAMPYTDPLQQREYFIWGATAGMLRNLYFFLLA
ncbi:MAG: CoA pyrophosphatase [Burkholderiaceae bacterium]|nr:MAG: CoA pyrophosphatase [Burkholderiaceae bacterium]